MVATSPKLELIPATSAVTPFALSPVMTTFRGPPFFEQLPHDL